MRAAWLDEWWAGGDAAPAAAPMAASERRRLRRRRAHMTALVGLSYAVDLGVLALFRLGGAVPGSLLALYAGLALAHLLLFGALQLTGATEAMRHPNLTGLQMAWALAMQVGAMLWAPAVAGYFVGVMFVVFSFGALRLPLRSALWMWAATSGALALLMWRFPPLGAMAPALRESTWVRAGTVVGVSTLLLRCLVLNFRAMALHARSTREAAKLAAEAAAARERATRDGLTGALNRDGLAPLLERELERLRAHGADSCVAMIDIDWFKSINDGCGHLTGDRVLRALVDLLHGHLRTSDRLARFGGEEFVLLMPSTGELDAMEIAERLRELVEGQDWSALAEDLRLTVSIGVAQAHPADRAETLIARADTALYGAKAAGRNRCCAAVRVDAPLCEAIPMHVLHLERHG
ncbi:MAG: GGDEF domain-containing protein [Betaproteobacteria bacterium]|nr:GGDEF domain-containing protein [Betaproteobacteria bacterium]